jgi:hypothetical protein
MYLDLQTSNLFVLGDIRTPGPTVQAAPINWLKAHSASLEMGRISHQFLGRPASDLMEAFGRFIREERDRGVRMSLGGTVLESAQDLPM